MAKNDRMPRKPTKRFIDEILSSITEQVVQKHAWPASHVAMIGLLNSRCSHLGGIAFPYNDFERIIKDVSGNIREASMAPGIEIKWLLLVVKLDSALLAAGIDHAQILARKAPYVAGPGLILFDPEVDVENSIIQSIRPIQKALFERFP